jgi:S1-C subfamily serine protease
MQEKNMAKELLSEKLSAELSGIIEQTSKSIVLVQGRRSGSSGVVWGKNLIVAADHTLPRSDQLQVQNSDGEVIEASVTGRDPSRDIALLKTTRDLQPLEKADATQLAAGQLALCIGRANGGRMLGILTMISGSDTTYKNWRGGTFDQFIRLDTAPFPGFSGSALILPNGKIAGVNTSAFSRHFGLTIPTSNIERLAQSLSSKGFIGKPYIGVMMQPARLPEIMSQQAGTDVGLLVVGTVKGGPAEEAGLFMGDILVRLDGKTLNSMEELHGLITEESVGKNMKITILRGGSIQELQVKVGERPLHQRNE